MPGERLLWTEPGWEPAPGADEATLRAMDSWLARDGSMRAPELHARRFAAACATTSAIPARQATAFFWAAVDRIPSSGRWFPRVELVDAAGVPRLRLWLRPAPPLGDAVRLWVAAAPDRRARPTVKGADLDHLAGLRREAAGNGADEAVILSAAGGVLEGASTSILWWRGDVLCAPPQDGQLLPGVTRALLFRMAAADGLATCCETPEPAELDGLETWAVNALHGIRPVTGWLGAAVSPGSADRAGEWAVRLERMAVRASGQRVVPARATAS